MGLDLAAAPETPSLASTHRLVASHLFIAIVLELQPVPPHAARVVVEGHVPVLVRHEAVWHKMSHDPALDASGRSVDGRVLETARAVARPVMRRLGRRRRDGRRGRVDLGGGVGELDGVRGWEVEEGSRLLSCRVCADEVKRLVACAGSLNRMRRVGCATK